MRKTVVMNVVGLTPALLGAATPQLQRFAELGKLATIQTPLPAVTCSVQATYLTGRPPSEHGIVGNGWYVRDECEIKFWRQSDALIQSQKLWEAARRYDATFTCANLFWWFNMYSSVDYAVTPRPMYPADGRKIPDIYTKPADLRFELQQQLGQFPLFHFWGPNTSLRSSAWIAAAAKIVDLRFDPTLTLIYLPHLDYCLQRSGPQAQSIAQELRDIDTLCGELIGYYQQRDARIIILSEYGITPVSRPIHINRELRGHGLLAVRQEMGREQFDAGASAAFAVCDHQIAHIYIKDVTQRKAVYELLRKVPGIAQLLESDGKREAQLNHPRSGDIIAIAEPDAWFTYYHWLDDAAAPAYARTVDIHRKPGYDPVELFVDPQLKLPRLKIGWTLLKRQLGFRSLLDVIPLDASLVRGSHGHVNLSAETSPLVITQEARLLEDSRIDACAIYSLILQHLMQ